MDAIIDILKDFGFPVVCFFIAAWYVKYREDKNDEQLDKLVSMHSAETDKLTEAINGNTLVIQKLIDKIDNLKAIGGQNYDDRGIKRQTLSDYVNSGNCAGYDGGSY